MSSVEQSSSHAVELASLRQMLEVSRRLAGPFDLEEMLAEIIDTGRCVLKADRGTVFLYDDATRELYLKIGTGLDELRFSIDQGIAGECARTRTILNIPDCYADPRFNREVDKQTGYRTNSLLAVPLIGLDDELVGMLQMLNAERGHFDETDEMLGHAFASHAAVAIQRVKLVEERMVKMKLERDLQLARQIQMNVLPSASPNIAGYDIASYSKPADQTGGDIFDLIAIDAKGQAACDANQQAPVKAPNNPASDTEDNPADGPADKSEDNPGAQYHGMLMLLADATGHGVGPAISVTQVRAMLRLGVRLHARLDDMIMHINNQLCDDLASERFVTAFLGYLDARRHEVIYHAPGQGPLLHVRGGDGRCTLLPASTFPLGILPEAPMVRPSPIAMEPGDVLALLTDGFYEYMTHSDEQYGNDRVSAVIAGNRTRRAQDMLDILLTELKTFAAGAPQMDDLTAIIVKRF